MENNNEAQEANQDTKTEDGVENTNFKEVELKHMSLDDMSEEDRNVIDMILKFYEDKIGNEIIP